MIKIITSLLFFVFLSGCFSDKQKQTVKENRPELGNIAINYYSNKSVTSLEVPPDLTKPDYENSFRLSEYINVNEEVVNLTNKNIEEKNQEIRKTPVDIEVKKSGTRRWLVVDKNPETLWELSKQFLKDNGFAIKKSNKKIGIIETDYLENKPELPQQSLGFIRSMLSSQIENISYTLPSVDSYRIRIEPIDEGKKSEVHLTLSSMKEVVYGSGKTESTMWQTKERDISLETEMLYKFMVFLGGDSANAREKMINSSEEVILVNIEEDIKGFAKLVFKLSFLETWDNISWAIDQLKIDLDDKDIKEKSFYIRIANPEKVGFISRVFGDEAIKKVFQLSLRNPNKDTTEVIFRDLSEENPEELKKYSYEFFEKIVKIFNK